MQTELLDIVVCPHCSGDLKLHVYDGTEECIREGSFVCSQCDEKYSIQNDIPFFAPDIQHGGVDNQRSTYSTWWDEYHDETTIIDEVHRPFFHESLNVMPDDVAGRLVLDAGCGNGRFSYVVSRYSPGLLVSFDISSGVAHARNAISKHNPTANVAYVQGDITRPPFKKGVFDTAFSWGVMHHTPDTKKTFCTVSSLVKPGGKFGAYVYEFHPVYRYDKQHVSFVAYIRSLFLIRPLRAICSRLPARVVSMIFRPVYYIERALNLGVMGCHGYGDKKWDKDYYFRVVIDRFKTRYASEHQVEEVMGWFKENGYSKLVMGKRPKISMTGVKDSNSSTGVMDVRFMG